MLKVLHLDYLAMVLSIGAMILLGRKRVSGWLVQLLGAFLWLVWGLSVSVYSLVVFDVVIIVFSVLGYLEWSRKS